MHPFEGSAEVLVKHGLARGREGLSSMQLHVRASRLRMTGLFALDRANVFGALKVPMCLVAVAAVISGCAQSERPSSPNWGNSAGAKPTCSYSLIRRRFPAHRPRAFARWFAIGSRRTSQFPTPLFKSGYSSRHCGPLLLGDIARRFGALVEPRLIAGFDGGGLFRHGPLPCVLASHRLSRAA